MIEVEGYQYIAVSVVLFAFVGFYITIGKSPEQRQAEKLRRQAKL